MRRTLVGPLASCWLSVATLFLPATLWAAPPLDFKAGERIAFVGNSLGERMNLFGHFESLLHSRFPDRHLVVRNFSRPADEVGVRQRPNDYTQIDDPLQVFQPDTFLCFFGYNESFAGPPGLDKFKQDYAKFMTEYRSKYGRAGRARFLLISPIAFEDPGDPFLPHGQSENPNLKLYTTAIAEVAQKDSLAFVDLFAPTLRLFGRRSGAQFTINGCHLNEEGDRAVALLLDRALFGSRNPARPGSAKFEQLRAAVNDKSWVHLQDYRMLNGWYVYGGRRTWDRETFPLEYQKIRALASVRDRYVWDIAQGQGVSAGPDDSNTGDLFEPKTRFGVPQQAYSEPKELRYLTGKESLEVMTPAEGFEVSLFASEEMFPELANPVQISFDNKGRLWVSCMPTYPQWKPGGPRPSDRLLILEDLDSDGRADRCQVFYDQLHVPTGFEFWNGGVLVISQPRLLFLKDADRDDRADTVVHWLDGWATDDTHHTMGAFEWSHGGLLHGLEGVSMSTTLETPWGPFRNRNTPGAYVVDPRSSRVRHFITPGYGNPWCYVFDRWGQGIAGDGTTAQQHWDSPLSGAQRGQRKGLNPIFDNQGMRPAIGSEFLYSRHFPEEVQGQFIYACVINMNGIPRFDIRDDGAGYAGRRIGDLLKSTDRNFRPADPQIGPDGALWFADWHNPLIGHMQYSQRDPNRDKKHGRVYRLTAKGRPLLKPATQFGKSVPELLNQLKEYEPRTRDRARTELRDRSAKEVLAEVQKWAGTLSATDKEYDRLLCEALWVQQSHHAVDRPLLEKVLRASAPEARAAATHLLADEWDYLAAAEPGRTARPAAPPPMGGREEDRVNLLAPFLMKLLAEKIADEHPRVRLEAVRALSFIPTLEAAELALQIVRGPTDYHLDYTLQHTLGALEPVWKPALAAGSIAKDNPEGLNFLTAYQKGHTPLATAKRHLETLLNPDSKDRNKKPALTGLAAARGKPEAGKEIFNRICVACHRIGAAGAEFGPDLTKVGERLKREELIESIIEPNAKVDPQFVATNITTKDGQEISGLVTREDEQSLTLVIGSGQKQVLRKDNIAQREALKVSSMPEGLAQGIAVEEFVDLVEYLASLK